MCLQVHSLHHKSYNPTAFSGTNMHPVEATLYYTAALIPVSLGLHPVHALGNVLPLCISQRHQYSFVSCHRGLRHGSLAGARWVHVAREWGLLSHVDMTNDCIKCQSVLGFITSILTNILSSSLHLNNIICLFTQITSCISIIWSFFNK